MFAINYGRVSAPQTCAQPVAAAARAATSGARAAERVAPGSDVQVTLRLQRHGCAAGARDEAGVGSGGGRAGGPRGGRAGGEPERRGVLGQARDGGRRGPRRRGDDGRRGARDGDLPGAGGRRPEDPDLALDGRDPANRKVSLASRSGGGRLPTVTQLALAHAEPVPPDGDDRLQPGAARAGGAGDLLGGRAAGADPGAGGPRAGRVPRCWDGRDDHGNPMSAGIYYAHLKAAKSQFTRTLMYLK